ncbi:tyrosine-type recombinase/integrase [Legionella parisiensis]|uniref:Tyr recombinase domain-containing protein n=1 Tax=Legionella parisiensis TaxID=45071 RepID=A0A1E5JSX0_9GAMM|nr:tyrosine-type recombinase/integrase [Legionella parisiensis]KTD43020.1 putative lambdoid prophage Rac integrase [Legionella parisiensis]OEH47503.1 hypothetical protein lpari_01426 [Legionella parisiensis]STX77906.1 putative lambdoid prophage Rac integrase [Legionella parisiensis]
MLSKLTSKSNFKIDPFDKNEVKAILDTTHHEQIRSLVQFAFFTGLRTPELIALEWEDVDLAHGIINVVRALVKKQIKGTKTIAGKRVFHNPRTNQPWETDHQIRRTAWIHTIKRAGIRYRNPYQTRHTYTKWGMLILKWL